MSRPSLKNSLLQDSLREFPEKRASSQSDNENVAWEKSEKKVGVTVRLRPSTIHDLDNLYIQARRLTQSTKVSKSSVVEVALEVLRDIMTDGEKAKSLAVRMAAAK